MVALHPSRPPYVCGGSDEDVHVWMSIVSRWLNTVQGEPLTQLTYVVSLLRGVAIEWNNSMETRCRGRPYWTLARPPSTCSGWDGRSSQRQSSISGSSVALPPAGFLQTDVRVHHKVTQDSPSRGAVTGHSQQRVHTHRRRQQNTGVKELLQPNLGRYNICPQSATTNLTHHWLAI